MTSADTAPLVTWHTAGLLGLGASLDDPGRAVWYDLINDRDTNHGLIIGQASEGTSNTAILIAAAARAHPDIAVSTCFISPEGLNDSIGRYASTRIPVQRETTCAALHAVADARTRAASARGLHTLAGSDVPVLLVVIDHAEFVTWELGEWWLPGYARAVKRLNIALLAIRKSDPGRPTAGSLWRGLARDNEVRLHHRNLGVADVRDLETQEFVSARIPHITPWADQVIGHDAPLDRPTADALGELYTPPQS